jgi:hypothetical protein
MKNLMRVLSIFALVAVIGFMAGCQIFPDDDDPDGNGNGGNGGGGSSGNAIDKAISITVGYSSSHTISSSGEHWFKFTGTGDPVIFETTGNVVDTYMRIWNNYDSALAGYSASGGSDDNSGEGSNALRSITATSGTTYWIKVEPRSGTSGSYTFVVKAPTSNIRTNPITVSVGNSSSHTITSTGTHWFRFTGTGNRVFFETEGNVVNTNLKIYIGDSTSSTFSGDKKVNFITVSGTTYYINITSSNSGTYTFIVRNGTGDGSSVYNAIEVAKGYSTSHTISYSGEHWFIYQGTGTPVTFKTTGNVVDTYMRIWNNYDYALAGYSSLGVVGSDDNSGDGSNALRSITATSGTTYWIKVEPRSGTSGSYTFVVE